MRKKKQLMYMLSAYGVKDAAMKPLMDQFEKLKPKKQNIPETKQYQELIKSISDMWDKAIKARKLALLASTKIGKL